MQEMSSIVEVVIGLIMIYLLIGMICMVLAELAEATLFKARGKLLCRGLFELFGGNRDAEQSFDMLQNFYENPLIYSHYQGNLTFSKKELKNGIKLILPNNLPSYIHSETFAKAWVAELLDTEPATVASLAQQIETTSLLSPALKQMLNNHIATADDDWNTVISSLQTGYEHMTARVAGWYKAHTLRVTLVLALVVAVLGNVDSLMLAKSLMVSDALLKEEISAAAQFAKIGAEPSPLIVEKRKTIGQLNEEIDTLKTDGNQQEALKSKQAALQLAKAELANLKQDACKTQALAPKPCYEAQLKRIATLQRLALPIGWQGDDPRLLICCSNGIEKLLGWLVTALVATLAASFWFDLLGKIMMVRSTLKPC